MCGSWKAEKDTEQGSAELQADWWVPPGCHRLSAAMQVVHGAIYRHGMHAGNDDLRILDHGQNNSPSTGDGAGNGHMVAAVHEFTHHLSSPPWWFTSRDLWIQNTLPFALKSFLLNTSNRHLETLCFDSCSRCS